MKANENKIKERENSKSNLISFSQILQFFPTEHFHLFILSRLTSCGEFFDSISYYKLVKKKSVARWVLWHFQPFTLTQNLKHEPISLYTSFFVIVAMRKNYKHKKALTAIKIKFLWLVSSRRIARRVYDLIAFERDGELYLRGALPSGIQNWIERHATGSLSRSRLSCPQNFVLWILI
jgi:hypothetical protein